MKMVKTKEQWQKGESWISFRDFVTARPQESARSRPKSCRGVFLLCSANSLGIPVQFWSGFLVCINPVSFWQGRAALAPKRRVLSTSFILHVRGRKSLGNKVFGFEQISFRPLSALQLGLLSTPRHLSLEIPGNSWPTWVSYLYSRISLISYQTNHAVCWGGGCLTLQIGKNLLDSFWRQYNEPPPTRRVHNAQ